MADRIERLIHQVIDVVKNSGLAIEHLHTHIINLSTRMEHLMSKISDFAAAMDAFTARQDVAVAGLQADVAALKAKIDELQNSAGQLTPEDQALLDAVKAHASTISDKLDALDAETPPAVPPVV